MPLGTRTDWFTRQIRDSNPAPGNHYRDTGTLCSVGYSGVSWSSSVSGGFAHYLNFGDSGLLPQSSYYRAYGFQVRCLLE